MRKVVLYSLLSLDGVAEDPGKYVFEFDDEMRANLRHVVGSQDAVVLGRRTYDEWAPYWPITLARSLIQEGPPGHHPGFRGQGTAAVRPGRRHTSSAAPRRQPDAVRHAARALPRRRLRVPGGAVLLRQHHLGVPGRGADHLT